MKSSEMSFGLKIRPLSNVQNLFHQKCLLHRDSYPGSIRPGSWVQCYFEKFDVDRNYEATSRQYYSICQLFPRDEGEIDICYLDLNVSSLNDTIKDYTKCKLIDVKQLSSTPVDIKNARVVNVIVQLLPDFFTEDKALNIHKRHLNTIIRILMRNYYMLHGCWIRNVDFSKCGIDCIQVEINDNELKSGVLFVSDENSTINIRDIRIKAIPSDKEEQMKFNFSAFKGPRQQLQEFMALVKMQRKQNALSKELQRLIVPLNILVVGSVGCGKSDLIKAFTHDNNCNVFRVTPTQILKSYPGESEQQIRKTFQAAIRFETQLNPENPVIIVLEDLHILCPDMKRNNNTIDFNMQRICKELCKQIDHLFHLRLPIMCLATTSSPESLSNLMRRAGRFDKDITIKSLTEKERSEIIKKLLKTHLPSIRNISVELIELMAKLTQGYTLGDINLLICIIARETLRQSEANTGVELIIKDNLQKLKPFSLKDTDITVCKTTKKFFSIGGMENLKRILNISVLAGMRRPETFRRLGLGLPKGILLYGPPGCAKTTIAECLATEANMRLICTSGADIYSPYVGCAEKFLSRIFDTARKNAPCLIFLDEIDSLVGRRSLSSDTSTGNVQLRILSTLLTEMDGIVNGDRINDHSKNSYILLVAATNRPDLLDDALLRPGRFDKLIHVPVPDYHTRYSIFLLQSEQMPFNQNINLDNLAERTENFSGADICNLCNEAALHAFQRDPHTNEILTEDFHMVLSKMKASLSQQQIDWYRKFGSTYKI